MNIAIITNKSANYSGKAIERAVVRSGNKALFLSPTNALSVLTRNSINNKIVFDEKALNKTQINLYIPRITNLLKYRHVLYHLSEVLGIYSAYSVDGLINASDKMRTLQRCSMNGIRVPKTALITNQDDVKQALEIVGAPCVVKSVYGSKGVGVSIADSINSAQSTIQALLIYTSMLLVEEFIPGGSKDIRAIVVGNRVVAAMQRSAPPGDFRANLSQGGKGIPIKLPKDLEVFCVKAARSLPLQIAGVDIILDKNGEPFLIEVNGNFGFGIQRITGIDIAEEIVQYSIRKYNQHLHAKPINLDCRPIGDEYLEDCFVKVKGKTVEFIDRNGHKQKTQINSANDIMNIMFSTFKMNLT